MSFSITEAFVQQYRDNLYQLSQQKGSRLRMAVRVDEGVVGKRTSFDRLAPTAAVLRTTRHSDTPLVSTPHSRRWANLADYDWADLVDKLDKVKMLIDPTSDYAMAGANAMGRSMDDVIIAAALGTAVTGETGSGTQALPAAQLVARDYVETGAAVVSGLTIGKLRRAKKILDASEVDAEDRYITVSSTQTQDLLRTTEVTSSDFNVIRALVQGDIDTFMGFKFIHSERLSLSTDGNSDRLVIVHQKQGLGLAIGQDIMARIAERVDKNHSIQAYLCMSLGAVRVEDERVVQIACDE